jgi:hypothetical protein
MSRSQSNVMSKIRHSGVMNTQRECRSTSIITMRGHTADAVPSRRELIAGVAATVSATAGCLDNKEFIAQCSSRGGGSGSQYLREIAPIRGEEQVSLGILVSDQAVSGERYHAVRVRDSDDNLVGSVPLISNRGMSELEAKDYPIFGSSSGELYAVPLDPHRSTVNTRYR